MDVNNIKHGNCTVSYLHKRCKHVNTSKNSLSDPSFLVYKIKIWIKRNNYKTKIFAVVIVMLFCWVICLVAPYPHQQPSQRWISCD